MAQAIPSSPPVDTNFAELVFCATRHIFLDAEILPSSRTVLRMIPLPDMRLRNPRALELGGRQCILNLCLTPKGASLELAGLDTLLELCFVKAQIGVMGEGLGLAMGENQILSAEVSAQSATRHYRSSSLTIEGLSLLDGLLDLTAGGPPRTGVRVLKYALKAVFSFPTQPGPAPPISHPLSPTPDNDVVFVFPRMQGRPNHLWASSSVLKATCPYFRLLLSDDNNDIFTGSFGGVHNRPAQASVRASRSSAAGTGKPPITPKPLSWNTVISKKTQNYEVGHLVRPWLEYDSDNDDDPAVAGLHTKGFSRKVKSLQNLPFSRPPPDSFSNVIHIVVKNTSFRTYRALLHYLTTSRGEIQFSTLISSAGISERGQKPNPYLASSPKSIYRLARQLGGLEELEELALRDLESQIGEWNLVRELCSDVALEYEEIQMAVAGSLDEPGGEGMKVDF